MSEESVVALLQSASDAYYNGKESPLDDETFDALVEQLRGLNPIHPFLQTVGAPPVGTSTPLPSLMPSLDKIKPGMPALQRFLGGSNYVVSEKLDGLSALWCAGALYLRGDGQNGVSIKPTHIQGLVKGDKSWMIRGELIMQKAGTTVSRSIVNGLLHQSSPDPEKLAKIQFVAYEVVAPAGLTRSVQFEWLTAKGFIVPWWQRMVGPTEDQLRSLFLQRRANSVYETDGIVLGLDTVPKRPTALKNPKDCVAFKMPISDQSAITTVREVLWAASAQGYLIPRLRFDPITVSGAVIEFCTAHNAKTVLGLGLGPGASVRIRRSGDVIPTIDEVIIPVKGAALPEGHEWDSNGVHIRLKEVSKEQIVSQLHHFAKTLGLEGLGPASCAALVEGGLTGPRLIWNSTAAALSAILGPKTGETLYKNLRALKPTEIQLCVASSKLPRGVGEAKLQALSATHPDPRTWAQCSLPKTGWTEESFHEFQTAYGKYEEWRRDLWFPYPIPGGTTVTAAAAAKATVCFTGFRDKALEEQLLAVGVATSPTMTSKVSALIVADEAKPSEKVKKAQAAGTEILTRTACIKKYLG
jgi:DNA ligase (NAD+)